MNLIRIKVESHSDSKAEAYPVCFYWLDVKYEIREISDRWYQTVVGDLGPVANYYKVRTAAKQEFILKHEIQNDQWFLVRPDGTFHGYLLN
jgi:hypothetical protein